MSKSGRELGPAGKKIFLSVFCLIFVAIGLAFWIPNSLIPILEWSARKRWKEVPCVIVRSPAGQDDSPGPELAFRYEFDGRTLESGNPGAVGLFSSGAGLLWKMKPGTAAVCYVNPRPPYEAVLTRDLDWEVFVWCFPLLFVVLPLWVLVLGLVRIGRPPAPEPEAPRAPAPGALVLGAQQRRGCGVVSQIFVLLFFIGFGALLLLIPGFRDDWLIRGFYLAPLGLGSVFLVRSLVYRFLRSFNPQITLTLTPGQAAPGQTIDLRWEAKGNTNRAKSFRITLEGREERQDRVGKGTQVRTEPFASLDVAKGGPKDLQRGSAKVTVPAPAMHSWIHGSRSIVWAFRVFAEIPLWPDVGEEYRDEVQARKAEPR
jgi:hypothetical protein